MSSGQSSEDATPASQLPWATVPRFVPGTTDITEYVKKVEFLKKVWPPEHLGLLAPRLALLCEGTSFKKVSQLDGDKLRNVMPMGKALSSSSKRWEVPGDSAPLRPAMTPLRKRSMA